MRLALRDTVHIRGAIGGANLFSVFLARSLAKLVDRLDIFTSDPDQYEGLSVHAVRSLYSPSRLRMGFRLIGKTLKPGVQPGDYDCVVFPSQVEPIVNAPKSRRIVVVHDLLPLIFPKSYPRLYLYYRVHLSRALCLADRVVTVSENTKHDVHGHFGIPLDRVSVIYPGFNRFLMSGNGQETASHPLVSQGMRRYLLYIGSQLPHKNLVRLIEGFSILRRKHQVSLLLVGGIDARYEPLYRAAAVRHGVRDCVHTLGTVPHSELTQILRGAEALVFPSLYEGFGMPPLEAMAVGVPVVAARTSSIPEVCGDAPVYFDPLDVADMAEKMVTVLTDQEVRAKCIQEGFRQAAKYDWDRTARQFVDMIAGL